MAIELQPTLRDRVLKRLANNLFLALPDLSGVKTFKNVNLLEYEAYKKCGLLAEEN